MRKHKFSLGKNKKLFKFFEKPNPIQLIKVNANSITNHLTIASPSKTFNFKRNRFNKKNVPDL